MKLKNWSDESPPQAKLFYSICHSRTKIINGIVSNSNLMKLKCRKNSWKHGEIEKQERRNPAVGETFFYSICHSRTQLVNGIVNAIHSLKYIYKDILKKLKLNE